MKVARLRTLAVASAPLLAAGSAPAAFAGITTESKPNELGIRVCNVYAVFDQPGVDRIQAVAGTWNNPLAVSVIDGTFFQADPFDLDTPPNPAFFEFFPEARYDSFVTIGVKSFNPNDPGVPEGQPEDNLVLSAGFPGFGKSTFEGDQLAWAVIPSDAQGDPFNPDFVAGDGRVLIMQLATLDGVGFEGSFVVQVEGDAGVEVIPVSFVHTCVWDCVGDDGYISIDEFLAVIGTWGQTGVPCDYYGDGVGIDDFLAVLGLRGPCPP